MKRLCAVILCSALGLSAVPTASYAAQHPIHSQQRIDWKQRDTATYVVSTINLLRTRHGTSVAQLLTGRMDIAHFDVYADTESSNLYFIELRKDNGDIAGALAYRIGWLMPRSVTPFTNRLGAPRADSQIVSAYKNDSRQFMDSFTSTLPS